MKFLFFLFIIGLSFSASSVEEKTIHTTMPSSSMAKSWMSFSSSEESNLKKLLELLQKSPTALKLLKEAQYKASRSGETLFDVIKVGEGSLTDTTLVRKFSPHSPQHVIYESRSVVYINRHLNWDDALLDLAHELTHYVYRDSFNPYAESFNAKDFIKSTIEGSGGEVQAFITECRVLKELFSKQVQSRSNCSKIEDEKGQLSYTKAVSLFYNVGPYYDSFKERLIKREILSHFTELKDEKINFISSAYGVPYPIAAMMEYDLVVNKVCENDKKRLAYMQQDKKNNPGRMPASVSPDQDKFLASYKSRCEQK